MHSASGSKRKRGSPNVEEGLNESESAAIPTFEIPTLPQRPSSSSPKPAYDQYVERDIAASLDQIIALGNDIILADHGRNEWSTKQDGLSKDQREKSRKPKRLIHGEDRALYSRLSSVNYHNGKEGNKNLKLGRLSSYVFQWPIDFENHPSVQHPLEETDGMECSENVDKEWEHFYGDGVDFHYFQQCRSKNKKSAHLDIREIHSTKNRSTASDPIPVPGSNMEVEKFIQRAWDKAVHIASNSVKFDSQQRDKDPSSTSLTNADDDCDASSNTSHTSTTEEEGCAINTNHRTRQIQLRAARRCKELGIEFQPIHVSDDDPYYICQSCNSRIRYESHAKTMQHLFGSWEENDNKHARGCCEILIRKKEIDIARGVMKKETMQIIDNLLQMLFQDDERSRGIIRKITDRKNWEDVCDIVKHYHDSAGGNDSMQCFEVSADILPFPSSSEMIKVVCSRLVERYKFDIPE